MKPAPFDYRAPKSLAETLEIIASTPNYRVIAGGQSLVPMLNLRLLAPDVLVDLNGIAEIAGVEEKPGVLRIGAMTRQRFLEKSDLVRQRCPLLLDALAHVGHQQTRNRGTFGGSLCHMDPGAELPVAAAALEATLYLSSTSGVRKLDFKRFPKGVLESDVKEGEILTHVEVPRLAPGTGTAFEEFSRRPADFAIVSCACVLTLDKRGRIERLAMAFGGVSPVPLRLSAFEPAAVGQSFGPAIVARAREVAAALPAEEAGEYSAGYRAHLAGVLAARALERAHGRATEGGRRA